MLTVVGLTVVVVPLTVKLPGVRVPLIATSVRM